MAFLFSAGGPAVSADTGDCRQMSRNNIDDWVVILNTPKIFVSYSSSDESYKNDLLRHLRLVEKEGLASLWSYDQIAPGWNWENAIEEAIKRSRVAILLVSPDYLASAFVIEQELPALMERAENGETLILPILLRPAPWVSVPALVRYQFLNTMMVPVSEVENPDREWARMAAEIHAILRAIAAERADDSRGSGESFKDGSPPDSNGPFANHSHAEPQVFLSHSESDGDFAELMQFRLGREGIRAWIDVDHLDPGVEWREKIDESIMSSFALVAIMSPDARASEYVTYEWAFAYGKGVPLVPIMLRQTSFHPRLATMQYLDFTDRRARPWKRFVDHLWKVKVNSG